MTDRPTEQRMPENHWEQPSFTGPDPQAPVWGQVIVPGQARMVVTPPSAQEQSLRTLRRLIFPVALVLAIITGDWLPVLILAIIGNAVLKRQLLLARQRRFALATGMR